MAASVAFGLAPAIALAAPDPSPPKPSASPAIPDATIGKAGAALHDVAKLQEKYEAKLESASPQQKQGLSQQANAEAIQAIQSHGLSLPEYSNVVRTAQINPDVKQRLLNAANKEP